MWRGFMNTSKLSTFARGIAHGETEMGVAGLQGTPVGGASADVRYRHHHANSARGGHRRSVFPAPVSAPPGT